MLLNFVIERCYISMKYYLLCLLSISEIVPKRESIVLFIKINICQIRQQ